MHISPINSTTSYRVPKINKKDNSMGKKFDRNFNDSVRRENRKMNGSGGRR